MENFGCRATQADGAALARQLRERGLDPAARRSQAQIVVVNTCTVTQSADQQARTTIRRIHRENPDCRIVVTGCYAQRAPEELAALPGVALVVGNSHKHRLVDIALSPREGSEVDPRSWEEAVAQKASGFVPISRLTPGPNARLPEAGRATTSQPGTVFVSDIFAHTELLAAPVADAVHERTRPILKVQDGCDNRCSFCVIPYVRGSSRSLPLGRILEEVNRLIEAGYREVVISGINLGRWGTDLRRSEFDTRTLGLADLVRSILADTPLEKLRISSVEPMDWTDELIRLVAESPRIAKHAHVPLQSGSDRILRRMHRKYRPWHYREKIRALRAAMPTAAIGADVMVGFPGESDADFRETQAMAEELPFTYLHVFPYSPRPGTEAARMMDQVSAAVRGERSRVLRQLAGEKKLAFMRFLLGQSLKAITLSSPRAPGPRASEGARGPAQDRIFTEALTDNYLPLWLKGRHAPNRWFEAKIEDVEDGRLIGVAGSSAESL
ncbi:MAG TPA: tRNA (N(6)-L-threonylcarbamoyladenosine(37)-C(2))-methylthiotransferase MtaB [Terriglobales bacterium]|nr:tRNA (N(6)-L-threonylcarbamoyladenosine(37)-C(2))-methylthiotransferase MtaB [Terriglobales bacterium]